MRLTANLPKHIAIIMDGNGRWAQKRLLPRIAGHSVGASVVRKLVDWCAQKGIKILTIFVFSTENWLRPVDEVSGLMELFVQYLEKEMKGLVNEGVRLCVIGDVAGLSSELQNRIKAAEAASSKNQRITLCVAANYGGRWDVLQAVKNWQEANPEGRLENLKEDDLLPYLSTAGLPDVDLMIRTGGEQRISNFLLWQSAYAELYFTSVLWPDFDEVELDCALVWYSKRKRRFGRTSEQIAREVFD